jgi:GNAT superfamily N-acetyltransferase
MTTFADKQLVESLEACEMAAWRDFYRSASREAASTSGLYLAEREDALVTFASKIDVLALNRVLGLGLWQPASDASLDDLVQLCAEVRAPRYFVQLNPVAKPSDLPERLERRGFRHYNNWMKLFRDATPPPAASTDLTVRRIDEHDAQAFAQVVADCFSWPAATHDWIASLVGRPGWHHYLALDASRPVASGAFFASEGQAWLDFAATLPDCRGRGAQSALLERRIRDAAELGCHRLVVETAEQTSERGAPSFRNTLNFGFRVAYVRPNYMYETKDSGPDFGIRSA